MGMADELKRTASALAAAEDRIKQQALELSAAETMRGAHDKEMEQMETAREQLKQQILCLQTALSKSEARSMIYLAKLKSSGSRVFGAQNPPAFLPEPTVAMGFLQSSTMEFSEGPAGPRSVAMRPSASKQRSYRSDGSSPMEYSEGPATSRSVATRSSKPRSYPSREGSERSPHSAGALSHYRV